MRTTTDTSVNDKQSQGLPGKNNEWYTPAKYIEAARLVMGGIDLDPASCEQANQVVKAVRYYTQQDNGLIQCWYGNVFCNPPYTSPDGKNPMRPWSEKMIREYKQGNVKQGIMFIMGGTYNKWFQPLWDYLICFTDHKVMFYRPGKCNKQLRDLNVFIYLGPNGAKFIEVFSQFGPVVKRVSPPKQELCTALDLWSALNTSTVDQESCRETA